MKLEELLINENPQYNPGYELDSDYLHDNLTKHIVEKMNIPDNLISYGNNLYSTNTKVGRIYFYADLKKKHLYAGVSGRIEEHHDKKTMFRTELTNKYDNNFKTAALKLYSFISKSTDIPVKYLISDEEHTDSSKKLWQKWLTKPAEYEIKEIYLYDTEKNIRIADKNLEPYWGPTPEYRKYRVIVRF